MNLFKHFERIALWKQLTFLGVLCLALASMSIIAYWHETNQPLTSILKEQQGLQPVRFVINIIQRTQQHRATAARSILDESIPKTAQRLKAEELEEAIYSYETFLDKHPNQEHRKAFERMVDYWHSLHQKISRKKIAFGENYDMHKILLNMQLDYLQLLIDYYRLSHDTSTDRYIIDVSLTQLPDLINDMARIRGYGIGLLIKAKATTDERAQLKAYMLVSEAKINAIDAAFRRIELSGSKTYGEVYQNYRTLKGNYEKIRDLTQTEILEKEVFNYPREDFYYDFTSVINGYYSCIYSSLDQLNLSLIERAGNEKFEIYSSLLCLLLFALIVIIFYITFSRRLLKKLGSDPKNIADIVEAISRGDLDSDVEIKYPNSLLANVKHMQEILRESDRVKSEYIATATHELKIPLSAISSTLLLAVNGELGAMPECATTYLNVAQKNSLRLAELIDASLDFNKLSVSKLEMDLRVQPLMPIVDDAMLSMTTYARKHSVHIIMGPRFEYLLVKVDARRLRQVLKNLLSNAAKFSNKDEEILINITVHVDKVRVDIIDHGCGIGNELQEGLFQKYPQELTSETSPANSAGLGLVISKRLVEAMGGEIGFTSTLGIGSCFFIDLPLEEPNSE
ncbi:MAG: HAMP domain-containing histidine kinase [Gammaproteobacteria bacterium]|nr:MAG: HAMP domain-containing histidine kinase [Gammaproteobacteria bacterium]